MRIEEETPAFAEFVAVYSVRLADPVVALDIHPHDTFGTADFCDLNLATDFDSFAIGQQVMRAQADVVTSVGQTGQSSRHGPTDGITQVSTIAALLDSGGIDWWIRKYARCFEAIGLSINARGFAELHHASLVERRRVTTEH